MKLESVGTHSLIQNFTHRIRQPGDLANPLGHAGDALLVEFQAIEHSCRKAALFACCHVEGVRSFDRVLTLLERIGHGSQAGVFLLGRELGQLMRRSFCLPRQPRHFLGQSHALNLR